MFNPYVDDKGKIDENTVFTYDLVSYGYLIVRYECGSFYRSDCLKGPVLCPNCYAMMAGFELNPSPHPELPPHIQTKF